MDVTPDATPDGTRVPTSTSTPEPAPPSDPAVTPPTPKRRRRWWAATLLAEAVLMVLMLVAAAGAALWWALRSDSGSAWLLSLVPGVQVTAPRGTLLGDFNAQRVTIRLPGGTDTNPDTVTLTDVGWRGLHLQRRSPGGQWLHLAIDDLHASRIDLALAPTASTAPPQPPANLQWPIELQLRSLRVDELHAPALGDKPLRELQARLHVGASAGTEHRVEHLSLAWDRLRASASGRIAAGGAMALDVQLQLEQLAAQAMPAWSARATLVGPLISPALQATVRSQPSTTRPAQSLDAHATLRPFAAWPLGELQAQTEKLDVSAFSSAAPRTALTGRAVATSSALDQPARVSIELSNALAGRWNEGRLPLRSVKLELGARPDDPTTLDVRTLDADLGTQQQSAGRITGEGRWTPANWTVTAVLKALQPSLLDARAAPMLLNGPLALAGNADRIDLKTSMTGQLAQRGPMRSVQVELDAGVSPLRIELRKAEVQAGGARASVTGLVTRAAVPAPWAVKGQANLVDFDPAVWWPGAENSAWRKEPTRLNANGNFDITLPAEVTELAAADLLVAVRGLAVVTFANSTLVGVPVGGEARLRSIDGGQALPLLKLDADGNHLRAEGRISTNTAASTSGNLDTWDVVLEAPALNRLAPVFKLFQPPGANTTLAGSLNAKARINGRWPVLTTQGQFDARALRVGTISVGQAQARWQMGTSASAVVEAEATLQDATIAPPGTTGPSLESAQLQIKGTGRAHTLEMRAQSKALPPAWTDMLQPRSANGPAAAASGSATAALRTIATLRAQGGLIDMPRTPSSSTSSASAPTSAVSTLAGWRGTLQQLELRSNVATAAPLLRTRDVAVEALWAGGPPRATVQPGRAELLGGAVRWSRIAWQAANRPGGMAQIDVQADIEPLRVAPLLASAQADFGWGGDLTLAGHLSLRTVATPTPNFRADIVIERVAGDLTVTDELGTQALGLTDLRVALNADNGVWNFTQALAGKTLGVAAGAVVARTSPQAIWPSADTPIQGVIELQVANLGTWGTWVPPGWRIDGALRTSASIGGRFGAPEYTGEIAGTRLAVRNFLQGVNVSEGDVLISLQGSSARIERFTARAGAGNIRLEGNASLGEAPKAQVKLTADKFQLLGRVDRRIVASGQAQLRLDKETLALDGDFNVDEGLIDFTRSDAPTLASDVEVVRAKGVASPAAAASAAASPVNGPTSASGRNVALNLNVTLGERLRVRGRGLDTGLRGDMKITSPGGRMTVNGSVRTAEGTYAAYGQKLTIDRGVISFNGPVDNPRLDIEATRPNIDIRVGVIVSGTAANPRIRLFSEPEMREIDKLSWLVMGRASDGLGRNDTALLQRAALALLAGEKGGVTDQITKAIGLDDVSVRQTDGAVRETFVSLGKQLSSRWYVAYERGLNATTGNWQLIYRIAQRFTLRAQAGDDNSIDVIWTWRWQ